MAKTKRKVKYIASNQSSDDEHPVLLEENRKRKNQSKLSTAFLSLLFALPVVFTLYLDFNYLSVKKKYKYNNVLSPIQTKNVNWNNIEKYIRYIVDKVRIHGMDEISGKWARNLPPFFRKCSKNKLELLGAEGFEIDDISMDPNGVYRVRCVLNTIDRNIVFFDIIKEKQPDGRSVFRLAKVY